MVMNTVIIMKMIALTITMMGAMMKWVMRNNIKNKSLKIAKTIKRMIMRNTMSIIVWMIMRKIMKMMRMMVTTKGQSAFDLHKVYNGH